MERVAKRGIMCSLISHLEANSFLQLVSEKCSPVIGTGSCVSGVRGSVLFVPTCSTVPLTLHPLASVYLPTLRDEKNFIYVGQIGSRELCFLSWSHVLMWTAPVNLMRRQKGRKRVSAFLGDSLRM